LKPSADIQSALKRTEVALLSGFNPFLTSFVYQPRIHSQAGQAAKTLRRYPHINSNFVCLELGQGRPGATRAIFPVDLLRIPLISEIAQLPRSAYNGFDIIKLAANEGRNAIPKEIMQQKPAKLFFLYHTTHNRHKGVV
jgi:hypothetical protein